MTTDGNGPSRRSSPFARTAPATDTPARTGAPEEAPPTRRASPVTAAGPTGGSAAGSGRSSPFAARSAAPNTTPGATPETPPPAASVAPAPVPPARTAVPLAGRSSATGHPSAEAAPRAQRFQPKPFADKPGRPEKAAAAAPTPVDMPKPPEGLDTKVVHLMEAMKDLSHLLAEENAALSRHDVDAVRNLAERKFLMTRFYREKMAAISESPRVLTNLPEEKKEVVRRAGNTLQALAKENGMRLKANIEAHNRFMKSIVTAVKERELEKATSYAQSGRVEGDPTQAFRKAVTFNETL